MALGPGSLHNQLEDICVLRNGLEAVEMEVRGDIAKTQREAGISDIGLIQSGPCHAAMQRPLGAEEAGSLPGVPWTH